MPEDRLLWLPSVSILLSAGIFPHCEARRGSEAPLLLLLSRLRGGQPREGGREGEGGGGWGGAGEVGGGVVKGGGVSEEAHTRTLTHIHTYAYTLREKLRLYLVFP